MFLYVQAKNTASPTTPKREKKEKMKVDKFVVYVVIGGIILGIITYLILGSIYG